MAGNAAVGARGGVHYKLVLDREALFRSEGDTVENKFVAVVVDDRVD